MDGATRHVSPQISESTRNGVEYGLSVIGKSVACFFQDNQGKAREERVARESNQDEFVSQMTGLLCMKGFSSLKDGLGWWI